MLIPDRREGHIGLGMHGPGVSPGAPWELVSQSSDGERPPEHGTPRPEGGVPIGVVPSEPEPGPGPIPIAVVPPSVTAAAPPVAASVPPSNFPVTCEHCGFASSMHPVKVLSSDPEKPVRFAIKCLAGDQGSDPCGRVRVFSYFEPAGKPADLSEVPPVLPSYPFIREMADYGARSPRGRVGAFLIAACDLHMLGLLEANPKARDAAFAGSAINLRKAVELFTRRFIFKKPVSVGSRAESIRKLAEELKSGHRPTTLSPRSKPRPMGRKLLYIIDVGDVSAHPDVNLADLHKRRYQRLADDGSIRRAISYFESVVSQVNWK
jgi:hypothetical protein